MPTGSAGRTISQHAFSIKMAGLVVRSLFILLLAVLTVRVASPQMETLSTLLDTPGDLVRVALGLAVCIWCIVNLFVLPKDVGAYRTWLYLGAAVLPLSLLCAIVVW
jgi:TRAP-type C4-dicarboxylate transport system permease small subunit